MTFQTLPLRCTILLVLFGAPFVRPLHAQPDSLFVLSSGTSPVGTLLPPGATDTTTLSFKDTDLREHLSRHLVAARRQCGLLL